MGNDTTHVLHVLLTPFPSAQATGHCSKQNPEMFNLSSLLVHCQSVYWKQPNKMTQLMCSFFPLHKFSLTIIQSVHMAWYSVGLMICSIHCTKHNDMCLHR